MTYRLRNILLAIGLAVIAMLLVLLYVTNYKRSVQHGAASVQVFVANHDIAPGTTGSEIVAKHELHTVSVARRNVVPGAISSADQIKALVLSQPIYAGEQITVRPFSDVAAQGVRAHLRGTLRAVEITGDPTSLLGGTLKQGDHVDLLANLRINPDSNFYATKIVVRNIPVLSSPSESTSKVASAGGQGQESVILALTDAQSQKAFFAIKNGDWTLVLRPVVAAADSHSKADTVASVLGGQ